MNETTNPVTLPEPRRGTPPGPTERPTGFAAWLRRAVPTALVLALLGGLAFWGHHTGWNLTGPARPSGAGPADGECLVRLLPAPEKSGWCETHGVHECPLCNPGLAQLPVEPKVSQADRERTARALAVRRRPANDPACQLHQRRLQFDSAEAAERAGVEVAPVWQTAMREAVAASGEVAYDPTRVARLSSRAAGTAWYVAKKVGDRVARGEVLALVDAADVGKAKAEFLQAVVQRRLRAKALANLTAAKAAVPERAVREAEAALREAQVRLLSAEQALVNLGLPVRAAEMERLSADGMARRVQFAGLPDALAEGFDAARTTASYLPVRSPLDGVVTAREVVAGEVVDVGKVLFVVADTRRMWLTLSVPAADAGVVRVGQAVRFLPDGGPGEVSGAVSWVSTAVDEQTRTVQVRAEVANDSGRLRAGALGTGRVVLREEPDAVVVPSEAVHTDGNCRVVFVRDKDFLKRDGPKTFHVRTVRVGASDGQNTEIIAGVLPGEVVAAKGSALLLNELLKNDPGECSPPAADRRPGKPERKNGEVPHE